MLKTLIIAGAVAVVATSAAAQKQTQTKPGGVSEQKTYEGCLARERAQGTRDPARRCGIRGPGSW